MTDRQKMVERIHDQMMYYGFDYADALKCATQLVTNGCRFEDGFQADIFGIDGGVVRPKDYSKGGE
ncbi:MAG: hypothetical protein KKC68_06665 [Candidatus Thermoplasmatota archaeon]|nr:hypothetical protein [Candidatus Thermoplasmatota archaeon]